MKEPTHLKNLTNLLLMIIKKTFMTINSIAMGMRMWQKRIGRMAFFGMKV